MIELEYENFERVESNLINKANEGYVFTDKYGNEMCALFIINVYFCFMANGKDLYIIERHTKRRLKRYGNYPLTTSNSSC